MRALLLLSAAILAFMPFAGAAPVPTITIRIDQSTQSANASGADQSVTFTGSVSVTKSAYLSATVTLAAAVDSGWQATVNPVSMTFTSTSPQSFSCIVVVPGGTPGGNQSTLTVSGTVVSGIFQSTGEATAVLQVVGKLPPAANQTGNGTGGTKPSSGNNQTYVPPGLVSTQLSAGFLGYSYEQWGYISVAAVAVLVAVVAVVRVRRRRKAVYDVGEAADD